MSDQISSGLQINLKYFIKLDENYYKRLILDYKMQVIVKNLFCKKKVKQINYHRNNTNKWKFKLLLRENC